MREEVIQHDSDVRLKCFPMSFVFNGRFETSPYLLVIIWSKSRVNRENYLESFPSTDLNLDNEKANEPYINTCRTVDLN